MAKKEIKANKDNKNKKSFFKGFKAELKKVSWPTPKQLVNNTVAVITIVLITAVIVFVLDLAFEALNKQGIEKIKEAITASNETSEDNTVQDNTVEDNTTENSTTTENNETQEGEESTDGAEVLDVEEDNTQENTENPENVENVVTE